MLHRRIAAVVVLDAVALRLGFFGLFGVCVMFCGRADLSPPLARFGARAKARSSALGLVRTGSPGDLRGRLEQKLLLAHGPFDLAQLFQAPQWVL